MLDIARSELVQIFRNRLVLVTGLLIPVVVSGLVVYRREEFSDVGSLGYIAALVVFTVTGLLIEPLLRQTAVRSAPALLGSTALVSTLISLVVTAIVSNGLRISGFTTWLLATIIVWLVALAARFLLPFIIFRRTFEELRDRRRD